MGIIVGHRRFILRVLGFSPLKVGSHHTHLCIFILEPLGGLRLHLQVNKGVLFSLVKLFSLFSPKPLTLNHKS